MHSLFMGLSCHTSYVTSELSWLAGDKTFLISFSTLYTFFMLGKILF